MKLAAFNATPEDRASVREACEDLLAASGFLLDAWNQDLWASLAAIGWNIPRATAEEALRTETKGRKRIKVILQYLEEKSSEVPRSSD